MYVGVCRLTFHLPANGSLKGKRQVAHSLITRLRQRFQVAAAEVDGQDRWQILVVGVSCVSNEAQHASRVVDSVVSYVEGLHIDAELIDIQREVLDGV